MRKLISLGEKFVSQKLGAKSEPTPRVADDLDHLHVRSPALGKAENGELTDRLLSHPLADSMPKIALTSYPAKRQSDRLEVAARLLKAYELATNDPLHREYMGDHSDGNMWDTIQATGLAELIASINTGDPKVLAENLEEFGSSFVWFGGVTTCIDGYNRDLNKTHVALTYWDSLVRVAEFLGVLRVESPETGPWGEALHHDVDQLVDRLEEHLKISLLPPLGIIHTDGLQVKDSALHYRHVNSLYAAIRVKQLKEAINRDARVLEIGGGIGIAALYARRLGIQNYTLLDIPITNLLSGHYLLNAIGQDAVCLFGENVQGATVNILPFWKCLDMADGCFDICSNQDSINELDDDTREFYKREIKRLTSDYFLSVNHECFHPKTAYSLFSDGPDYTLLSRSPYWPRSGYVEELYDLRRR